MKFEKNKGFSIFFKQVIIFVIGILAIAITATIALITIYTQTLTQQYIDKGNALIEMLAQSSVDVLVNKDESTIQSLVDSMLGIKGVSYILLITADQQLAIHTFAPACPKHIIREAYSSEIRRFELTGNDPVIDIAYPVLDGKLGFFQMGIAVKDISQAAWNFLLPIVIILFSLVAIGIILFVVLTKIIINRNLNHLNKQIHDLAQRKGDLSKLLSISSKDEIGDLGMQINTFIESIREIVKQILTAAQQVKNTTSMLDGSATKSEETTEKILQESSTIKDNLEKQSDISGDASKVIVTMVEQIDSFSSQINELAAAIDQVSNTTEELVTSIQNVTTTTHHSQDLMQNLQSVAQEGGSSIKSVIEGIEDIENSSQEITDILSLINNLASQTNLLAMNASIEAAHAGDAGKGFSVVAEEIRKLAENSANATKNIKGLIANIIDKINNTVAKTKEADSGLNKILTDVQEAVHINSEITSALTQQNQGIKDMMKSVSYLSSSSKELRDFSQSHYESTQQITHVMNNLDGLSFKLSTSSSQQKDMMDTLNQLHHGIRADITKNTEVTIQLLDLIHYFKIEPSDEDFHASSAIVQSDITPVDKS